MDEHKLKTKKVAKGKQLRWGLILLEGVERSGRTPVSHHAEDRFGFCGRCGHYWDWHDNVWLPRAVGQTVSIRCRGSYEGCGPCRCREVYVNG